MKVYIVRQSEGGGSKRIRGVFSTKQKAKEYIGPQDKRKTIPCNCCGQQKPNPEYDELESWKQKLSIQEWDVE